MRRKRKDDFKVVGLVKKREANKRFPYLLEFFNPKKTYYLGFEFEDLTSEEFHQDWASIVSIADARPFRVGRAFVTASGRSITFSIAGMQYYASLRFLRNLVNRNAQFCCMHKRVAQL